jgi:hypothetical protein
MAAQVEKVLEAAIARGIEQLHATVESTMARFLAHANVGVQGQTCVKTNIDIAAMVAVPTIVVGADQQLHIGSDPIKLGIGNGSEVNATNGQEGLAMLVRYVKALAPWHVICTKSNGMIH